MTLSEHIGKALGELAEKIIVGAVVAVCDDYVKRNQFLEDGMVV